MWHGHQGSELGNLCVRAWTQSENDAGVAVNVFFTCGFQERYAVGRHRAMQRVLIVVVAEIVTCAALAMIMATVENSTSTKIDGNIMSVSHSTSDK